MAPDIGSIDQGLVDITNQILAQLHASSVVRCIEDIGATVFVTLFEGLYGERLSEIVRDPHTREDEIHNCQVVIDTLSKNVLRISLGHITGKEIIDGDKTSIANLLEIFAGLLEFITSEIDCDQSVDCEEFKDTENDQDTIPHQVINEIIQEPKGGIPGLRSASQEMAGQLAGDYRCKPDEPVFISHEKDTLGMQTEISSDWKHYEPQTDRFIPPVEKEQAWTEPSTPESHASQLGVFTGRKYDPPSLFSSQKAAPKGYHQARISPPQCAGKTDMILNDVDKCYASKFENMPQSSASFVHHLDKEEKQGAVHVKPFEVNTCEEETNPVHQGNKSFRAGQKASGHFEMHSQMSDSFRTVKEKTEDNVEGGKFQLTSHFLPTAMQQTNVQCRSIRDGELKSGLLPESYLEEDAKRQVDQTVHQQKTGLFDRHLQTGPGSTKPAAENVQCTFKSRGKKTMGDSISEKKQVRNPLTRKLLLKKKSSRILCEDESTSDPESEIEQLRLRFHDLVDDSFDEMKAEKSGARKQVRFNDTPGRYQELDPLLNQYGRQTGKSKRLEFLKKSYLKDLTYLSKEASEQLKAEKTKANEKEKEYKKLVTSAPKNCHFQASLKYRALPIKIKRNHPLPRKKITIPKPVAKREQIEIRGGATSGAIKSEQLLPTLLEEFPNLHLSNDVWHELWRKNIQQIEQLTRAHQRVRRKKGRAQSELDQAEKRQQMMYNIMQKELCHAQRQKEHKERKVEQVMVKNKLHEKRMVSARTRRYYDDYHARMRAKMLSKTTREEIIFKKLFEECLSIQKENMQELQKYAKEQRKQKAEKQQNEIDSLENYYHDQFKMLAEMASKEHEDLLIREQAREKILKQMKKELRKKLQMDVENFQEELYRNEDSAYFRQLEAERLKHEFRLANHSFKLDFK